MSDISTRIVISARDEASATLKQISREADALQGRWSGMQKAMSAGLGIAGVAGVSLGFDAVIRDAAAFETAVNNIGKVTDASLAGISRNLKGIDASLGSSTQLAQGYYQVMSAGITDAVQAQEMLVVASKVAKTAGISQAEAINALAKVMNGYQGEIKSAEQAANMFFTTEKLGMTDVAQLAPVMGDLAGVAKTLGATYDELGGSMAVVTQTTGSTATAATYLRALMLELMRPTETLKGILKDLGVDSAEALVKMRGFPDALKAIQERAAATGKSMGTVFGGSEASQGFIKLMDEQFSKLKSYSGEVAQTTDALSKAWGRHTQSVNGQLDEMVNRFSNLSTTIGGTFGGATLASLEGLNTGLGWLTDNFDSVSTGAMTLGAGLAALTATKTALNSTTLNGLAASKQELGTRGLLNEIVLRGNEGLRAQVEASKQAAQAALKAAEADVTRLERQKALLVISEKQADRLATRLIGSQNEARAEQVLAGHRERLATINGQLAAAENTLATAQVRSTTAAKGLGTASLALEGAKKAAGGLVAMLGGPWGVAFTAAAAGATYLATKEDEGARFAREHADAMSLVTGRASDAANAMQAYARSVAEMTESQRNFEIASTKQSVEKLFANNLGGVNKVVNDMTTMFASMEDTRRIYEKFQKLSLQGFAQISADELRTMIQDVQDLGTEFERTSEAKTIIESLLNPLLAARLKLDALTQSAKPAADGIAGMAGSATAAYAPLSALKEILDTLGKTNATPTLSIGTAVEQLQKDLQSTKVMQERAQADTKTRIADNLKLYGQQLELAREEQRIRERLAAANPGVGGGVDHAERARQGAAELAKAEGQFRLLSTAAGQFGEKADSSLKAAESQTKSLTSELAKLQLTDAAYQQWQVAQKIAELEKTLGKANPKVKELQAALQNDLEAKFLASIQEYADPAAAQLAKVQKEYQKILDMVNASEKLSGDQKKLFNVQAAQQYEKALAGVAGTTQNLAKFTKETAAIEAELAGDREVYWADRKEQLLEQLGYSEQADKAAILAATEARIRAERLQKEADSANTFGKLWEETYKRVDQSMSDWLYNMFSGAEAGFKGLKDAFLRMLAEMANAALLRPITVQIMGVMGGVMGGLFGGSGTAQAGQLATGTGAGSAFNLPGMSSVTSFLPESWTSGISSFLSTPLPGTAIPGLMGPTPSGAALSGGLGLGSALGYGALGGIGYNVLGGLIGLPQSTYSGFTASLGGTLGAWGGSALATSLAGGGGMLAGATAGSVIPIVGTILGAIGGGLLGSLFGGERKTRPSVYTQAINMPIDSGYDYTQAFMDGAWYDRAGAEEANKVMPILGEAAKVSAQQIEALVAALPEEFRGKVEAEIQSSVFHAGRGIAGMDKHNWNFQFYDEEQLKQRLEAVVKDIQVAMGRVAQDALADVDLTSMYSFDLSSSEGMDRAVKAVTAVKEITEATKAISEPTSQIVEQAKAAKAQMDQWTKSMQEYGVVAEYAKEVVGEYQRVSIKTQIDALEDSMAPLSAYEQAVKAANASVDDTVAALRVLGAAEEEVARVEGMRAQVLEAMTGAMVLAFDQDLRIRQAQLSGDQNVIASTQLAIQHERELADVRAKFGEASVQYQQILDVQLREQAQLMADVATQAARAAQELAAAKASFAMDYSLRMAEAGGQDTTMARLAAQQESEIQRVIAQFGAHSQQYFDLVALHGVETQKAMQQAAENAAAAAESAQRAWDAATEQVKKAEQAILQYTYDMVDQLSQKMRDVLQAYVDQANNLYDQAQDEFAQGLRREMDKLSSSIDGFSRAVTDMRNTQKDIWRQNVTPAQSYASLSADMQALYAKAAGGDVDAASEFTALVSRWLDASYQSQGDFAGYDKDRLQASAMLEELSGLFDGQKSEAQKQLDALQDIYDAIVKPEQSLDQLLIELIAARTVLDKTLAQQGDYYGKWQLGDLHGELGQIDFSTLEGSKSISEYIQKNGREAIAHLLGLSGDVSSLEDSTVKNLLDMIGGVDNLDSETKKQTGVFEDKLTQNIHELYSSIKSLQALELELSKAMQDKMDAIGKYGPLQINDKLEELKQALVAAIKNQASVTPPSGGGGGGGTTSPTKPTGALSQSQILTYYRPDVASALSNGSMISFSYWWDTYGKYEVPGVTWSGYEGSAYHSSNYLGSKYATQSLLLQAKVDALNNSRADGRSNWTAAETRKVIEANGGWEYWYRNYGRAEGFASGGVTVPGVRFEANEGGEREIFMSPIAQGVLSADDSKRTMDAVIAMGRLMAMPAAPADTQAALLQEVRGLREENARMRQELSQMREHVRHIDDATRKANDRLTKWDNDGLPGAVQ